MTIMKTMRILAVLALTIVFASCEDNDPVLLAIESETVTNLHAPQSGGQGQPISGEFTKFDFETGAETTSNIDWDIAFRGTTIIVNGGVSQGSTDEPARTGTAGAYIADGTLASVTDVNVNSFAVDAVAGLAIPTGSDNGWYNYAGPPSFLITPLAGKIIVVRTTEGRYAKMEILSYYENAPDMPNAMTDASRYFTFNYVYQPNEGVTTFE
jgi:hypothetical protein